MGIEELFGGGFHPLGTMGGVAALLGGLGLFLLLGPFSAVPVAVVLFLLPFWGPTAPREEPRLAAPPAEPEEFLPWLRPSYWRRWHRPRLESPGEALGALFCGILSLILGPFVAVAAILMAPHLARMAQGQQEPLAQGGGRP